MTMKLGKWQEEWEIKSKKQEIQNQELGIMVKGYRKKEIRGMALRSKG